MDAVLLTFLPDIRWACGFTGSNGILIVSRESARFVTDGRYRIQAGREVIGAEVFVAGGDLLEYVADQELVKAVPRVLVQGDHLTLSGFEDLKERLPEVEWRPVGDLLVADVASKEEDEIRAIRAAQAVTEAVFEELLDLIRPGMTEREMAAEIVFRHLRRGAERMSFDPIVASGPESALPHARPTDKKVQGGELLLLDFGCFLGGYASDMTRTIAVGEPGEEARRVHQLVRHAQQAALDAAHSGMSSVALDAVARDVIKSAGHGDHFGHGLGHGVGLQIHEWPRVTYHTDVALPEGAVVSIEPGVYLPGRFGVRLEDLVVLRQDGAENLTRASKELIVL